MAEVSIDLHVHTNASDGAYAPSEVVSRAVAAGLGVLAIADHDTTAGVEPAREAARDTDLTIVPAIEVSAAHRDRDIHILGYGVNPADPGLLELGRHARTVRAERVREMIRLLDDLGVEVRYEDVEAEAGPNAQALARPHLARVLWSQGVVGSVAEAFDRFLADGGPAYVPVRSLGVSEAIRHIHDAGGLAVWAHPPMPLLGEALREFVEAGLDGIECYRPRNSPADVNRLLNKARQHGLLATGGSDWHGDWHGALGTFQVEATKVASLLERLGV